MEQLRGGLTVTYRPEGSAGIAELQVRAGVPPFVGAATGFDDEDLCLRLGRQRLSAGHRPGECPFD